MPRKKAVADVVVKKSTKKNIIDTMIKDNENEDDDIILQLAISQNKINNIINNDKNDNKIVEPTPYESMCYFTNDAENISCDNEYYHNNNNNNFNNIENKNNSCCFWCCHSINANVYGMPYNYDTMNDTFYVLGSFCSLQCANAYNFSINCGSDKVWEINSWIQMIAKRYGYNNIIRPAPSRYLLKMFGGNLTIEDFREAHLNSDKTHVLNIPPMISINITSEVINTSYLHKHSNNKKNDLKF
jgi:hypothetical protein